MIYSLAIQGGWISAIPSFAVVIAAVIGGGTIVYKAIKRIQANARTAKALEETLTQGRIAEAVERAKAEMAGQIQMAEKVAKHWEQLAGVFEKEKEHERELFVEVKSKYETETERLRAERNQAVDRLEEAKVKLEEVLDLNLGYQGQITENTRKGAETQSELNNTKRQLRELQEKVQAIDGLKSGN